MSVWIRCDAQHWLGASPTLPEIEQLARRKGFRALLNLNEEGEPDARLSPNVEASWAHTYELQHERATLPRGPLDSADVSRALDALRRCAQPVFVHSQGGRRAAALLTIWIGLERCLGGRDALAAARALGIECGPELEAAVRAEIHQRLGLLVLPTLPAALAGVAPAPASLARNAREPTPLAQPA